MMQSNFELLESRRMFATLGTWTPLVITGTSAADTITLSQSGENLTVVKNGVATTYDTQWVSGIGSGQNDPVIYSGISKVVINGLAGNDTIHANSSVQEPLEVFGGAGTDSIRGGNKNDKLYGGANLANGITEMSSDTLDGGNGNDSLYAPAMSAATLYGGAGNDTLNGGNGNDLSYGGNNNDVCYGNGGEDFQFGEAGSDIIWGGAGMDTISYQYVTAASGVTVKLDDLANDGVFNEMDNIHSDVERVWGSKGNDVIAGSMGANLLAGDNGNDQIHGLGGNDSVYGDVGNDKVWGDAGNDLVSGGEGSDSVYGGSNTDTLFGDSGSDVLISVGGGTDQLWGGTGTLDSFWTDSAADDVIGDVSGAETTFDAVHRISAFESFKARLADGTVITEGVSKNLSGQDIADPVRFGDSLAMYADFSDRPLFNGFNPSMDDIDQAGGGSDPADCYYMAVLSAAAMQNPNFIKQRIVELGDGTYAMRVWKGGVEKFIRMDGDLPANNAGGPQYAGFGTGNAIWVPMMEKGLAMMRDVRAPHNNGTPGDTSDDFDGDPIYAAYERVAFGNESEMWTLLGSGDRQVRNSGNLAGGLERAQWAMDELLNSVDRGVTIAWGGHVRTVEGGVYTNGVLSGLRLRDPYGQRYNISAADIATNDAWITSAVIC